MEKSLDDLIHLGEDEDGWFGEVRWECRIPKPTKIPKNEYGNIEEYAKRRCKERILRDIIEKTIEYLKNSSTESVTNFYGGKSKIHITALLEPDDLVLVLMHPKRMAELLSVWEVL